MKLPEFDYKDSTSKNTSIFKEIFENEKKGFVIRNFIEPNHLITLEKFKDKFENIFYIPFEGYKALPRPFDEIEKNKTEGYLEEINILNSEYLSEFTAIFLKRLQTINTYYSINTANSNAATSKSKAWASLRVLHPKKGQFELHCGNLFLNWNKLFFQKQKENYDVSKHLAFLLMVQKPECECDIKIYDAHWDNYKEKIDSNNLMNINNEIINLKEIEVDNVNLNPGDLLIFDESNFWHNVLPFAEKERITFGGFVSKKHNKNEVLLWA